MELTASNLVDSFYHILSTSTGRGEDSTLENNSYYTRRVRGFMAEIEIVKKIEELGFQLLEGGQLFNFRNEEINQFTYSTIDDLDPDAYLEIYKRFAAWDEIHTLFYIKIITNSWVTENYTIKDPNDPKGKKLSQVEILKPKFETYQYNINEKSFFKLADSFDILENNFKKKDSERRFKLKDKDNFEYLKKYDIEILKKIYATRYYLNVTLHSYKNKFMQDFDGFFIKDNKIVVLEVKEKEPIENEKSPEDKTLWAYGWDTRRLLWFTHLYNRIYLDTLYIVRRVHKEGASRDFEGWDSIFLSNFLKNTAWSYNAKGTQIAPYSSFDAIENNLQTLSNEIK